MSTASGGGPGPAPASKATENVPIGDEIPHRAPESPRRVSEAAGGATAMDVDSRKDEDAPGLEAADPCGGQGREGDDSQDGANEGGGGEDAAPRMDKLRREDRDLQWEQEEAKIVEDRLKEVLRDLMRDQQCAEKCAETRAAMSASLQAAHRVLQDGKAGAGT